MSSPTWYSRALPRTVVNGIVGATVLVTTAFAAVAESCLHASRRSESAQLICALFAVTLLVTAVSLVLRTKNRLALAGLSATAMTLLSPRAAAGSQSIVRWVKRRNSPNIHAPVGTVSRTALRVR